MAGLPHQKNVSGVLEDHSSLPGGQMPVHEGYIPLDEHVNTDSQHPAENSQSMPVHEPQQNDDAPLVDRMRSTDFWTRDDYFLDSDEEIVHGKPADLWYAYPDIRGEIVLSFGDWEREHPYSVSHKETAMEVGQDAGTELGPDSPLKQFGGRQSNGGTKKPAAAKSKKKERKDYRFNPDIVTMTVADMPAYAPHLSLTSASACREYLAYAEPDDVVKLQMPKDDWREIKTSRMHQFAGKIFDALLHPFADQAPDGTDLGANHKHVRYVSQQQKATMDVGNLLGASQGVKRAQASCYLLVDAVVHFHEHGVPKTIYNGHKWHVEKNRIVDRYYRLDLKSICSVRLNKIVEIVKANKLIAQDILEGKNFMKMTQDPDFYLQMKFVLLRSNESRQARTDKQKAREEGTLDKSKTEPALGRVEKTRNLRNRKRKVVVEESEDEEDIEMTEESEDDDGEIEVGSEEEYVPPRKRARRN